MMDITIARRDLLSLVSRAANVTEVKNSQPALAYVLLITAGAKLRAFATDLYTSIDDVRPADVKRGGSIAVPAKDLSARVKAMPEGPVQLTVDGTALSLKATGSARRYRLNGISADDFPSAPDDSEARGTFTVKAKTLAGLIAMTHLSISTDETRSHLNSLFLEVTTGLAVAVSTDGHRLMRASAVVEYAGQAFEMLIPLKAVHELKRVCDDAGDGVVQVSRTGPNGFFKVGTQTLSSRVPAADFPDWRQIVPKSHKKSISVPRAALADMVRAVALASNEKTGAVKFSLDDSKLTVTSESPDSGDGFDELAVEYTGEAFKTGVNAKYLADALGASQDDMVMMAFTEELDPIVLKPEDGDGWLGIVMPLRT